MTSQKKAEPFRVTGPGRYQTRDGQTVTIRRTNSCEFGEEWIWTTDDHIKTNGIGKAWHADGTFATDANHRLDLIGRLEDAPAEEMAGLSGYVELWVDSAGVPRSSRSTSSKPCSGGVVCDLSTIRKDQLVQPEPKTETRKVSISFFPDGSAVGTGHGRTTGKRLNGEMVDPVAIVDCEITFKHGEGLGQELPS